MPDQDFPFDGLRPLEVPEAAYLAKRLGSGEIAGVLAKSEWGVDESEPLVLCQKMEDCVVGWGTVTLSAPVKFASGWEASDRVAKAVGKEEIDKATGEPGPVWYHSLYKADLWPEPVVVKAWGLADAGRKSPGVGSPWKPDAGDPPDPDVPYMMQPEDEDLRKGLGGEPISEMGDDGLAGLMADMCALYEKKRTGGAGSDELGQIMSAKQVIVDEMRRRGLEIPEQDSPADGEHEHTPENPLGEHSHQDEDDPDAVYQEVEAAEWSTAMINDLPDSAFLWVEAGGEKDDEGKTKPRSLRHLPVRGPDGELDLPHLRNALARMGQLKDKDGKPISQSKLAELRGKAERLLEGTKKALPRVITKSAVESGWMPESGSGLPPDMEAVVPGALRYWEQEDPADRAMFRDMLVKSDLFDTVNGPLDSADFSRVDSGTALESQDPGGERHEANGVSNAIHKQIHKALSEPMPVVKASDQDDEWGYVLSVALEANDGGDGNPLNPDAHNDIISEEDLQRVAREFARDFRRFGEQHEKQHGKEVIRFADSFVLPHGWKMQTDGGHSFDHPVWLVGAEVRRSSDLWKKISSGKINAWSIDGRGLKVPEKV